MSKTTKRFEVDYVNKNRKVSNDINYKGTKNLINSIKIK